MTRMELPIEHDRAGRRFTTHLDGHRAVLDYQLEGNRMAINHTGVPHAIEGRGVASALMRRALDTARAEGWRVLPVCAYAAAYLRRHPADADLVD
jgi:predicted GNAT family acetyltransferase